MADITGNQTVRIRIPVEAKTTIDGHKSPGLVAFDTTSKSIAVCPGLGEDYIRASTHPSDLSSVASSLSPTDTVTVVQGGVQKRATVQQFGAGLWQPESESLEQLAGATVVPFGVGMLGLTDQDDAQTYLGSGRAFEGDLDACLATESRRVNICTEYGNVGLQSTTDEDLPIFSYSGKGVAALSIVQFGATGGLDDTAAIQRAIDAGGSVYVPPGTWNFTSLTISQGSSTLFGAGAASILNQVSPTSAHAILASGLSGVSIKDLSIHCLGTTAGLWAGVCLKECTDSHVSGCSIYNADTWGIWLLDCSRCAASNCSVSYSSARYTAQTAGYGMEMDGCDGSRFMHCHAHMVSFGFLVIANDGIISGGNSSSSLRANADCTGNAVIGCVIDGHTAHAMTFNACSGNMCIGTNSYNYTGLVVDRSAFQNKHTNSDESRRNIFSACVADGCYNGFYSQDGSGTDFSSCTVKNAKGNALWANSAPRTRFVNCRVEGFGVTAGGSVVRIEASNDCTISGIVSDVEAGTGTLYGVTLINSDRATIGEFKAIGSLSNGINIDAASDNTVIGELCRLGETPVIDLSSTTVYPFTIQSQEFPLSGGVVHRVIGTTQRGVRVGRVRLVTTVAVGGTTPTGGAGRLGANQSIVADVAFGAAAGDVVQVLAASLGVSNPVTPITVSTNGAATSGSGIIALDCMQLQG